jgi:hypothetical protein
MRIHLLGVIVALGASFPGGAGRAGTPEVPHGPMPEQARALLGETLGGFAFTNLAGDQGLTSAQLRATKEAALKILGQMSWPEFDKLERVHFRDPQQQGLQSNLFQGRWSVRTKENQLVMLGPGFSHEWRVRDQLPTFEKADYKAELGELLDVLRDPQAKQLRTWDWQELGLQFNQKAPNGNAILDHAVAAAGLGHNDEARRLNQGLLRDLAVKGVLRGLGVDRAHFHGRVAFTCRCWDSLNRAKNVCGDTASQFSSGCWRRSVARASVMVAGLTQTVRKK